MGIIYVLILVGHIGYGTGLTTQEFLSKDKCEEAGSLIKKRVDGFSAELQYICVEK